MGKLHLLKIGLTIWCASLVLVCFAPGFAAHAREYELVEADGLFAHDYTEIINKKLLPGDVVHLPQGKSFTLGARLGCGGTTCVFALAHDPKRAIRFPSTVYRLGDEYIPRYLKSFVDGYGPLRKAGVPVVRLHEQLVPFYALVDRIESVTSLEDFLLRKSPHLESERAGMLEELLSFAKKTAQFDSIGDFGADQVHYSRSQGWILVDWTRAHGWADPGSTRNSRNAFDALFELGHLGWWLQQNRFSKEAMELKKLRLKINLAINEARAGSRGATCSAYFYAIFGRNKSTVVVPDHTFFPFD